MFLREFTLNEDVLYDIVLAMFLGPHEEASTAAGRVLLAASPVYSEKAPPVIYQLLHEEVRAIVVVVVVVVMLQATRQSARLNYPLPNPHAPLPEPLVWTGGI